ncbi:hypothetical protein ASD48_20635 [Streptomyces sp. Root1310]|nr:hypothetical protein ASD48_20635 [Streptomyces sp. Root1310]
MHQPITAQPLPTAKAIEIDAFVAADDIDPIRIGEGYHLSPDGQVAAKPYKLLRETLARSSKVAIAKYAWSGRERLGTMDFELVESAKERRAAGPTPSPSSVPGPIPNAPPRSRGPDTPVRPARPARSSG